MFITSDAGNTWRQVRLHSFTFNWTIPDSPCWDGTGGINSRVSVMQIFDEEHNVWFLDNGGAMLAVLHATTPLRHLW